VSKVIIPDPCTVARNIAESILVEPLKWNGDTAESTRTEIVDGVKYTGKAKIEVKKVDTPNEPGTIKTRVCELTIDATMYRENELFYETGCTVRVWVRG